MRGKPTTAARFWAKVDVRGPDECWPYLAPGDKDGYRRVGMGGRLILVHRVAWVFTFGPIPPHMLVCHSCDNPPCCNPAHLWLGFDVDNNADKEAKGRGNHPRGSAHGRAKLTEAQVADIRARYAQGGISQSALADEYGVIQITISRIIRREIWPHV